MTSSSAACDDRAASGVPGRAPGFRRRRLRRPRPPHRRRRARHPRPRAGAAARVRNRAARAHARPRDQHARQASCAQARPAGAGGVAGRRVPARVLGGRHPRRRQRDRGARPQRPARARGRVHERRHAPPLAGHRGTAGSARRGHADGRCAQAFLPRLGGRGLVGRAGPRRRTRPDARPERAAGARRPPQPPQGGRGCRPSRSRAARRTAYRPRR